MLPSCLPVPTPQVIMVPERFYLFIILRFKAGAAIVAAATIPDKMQIIMQTNQFYVVNLQIIKNKVRFENEGGLMEPMDRH